MLSGAFDIVKAVGLIGEVHRSRVVGICCRGMGSSHDTA